jgi:hypothetical protein
VPEEPAPDATDKCVVRDAAALRAAVADKGGAAVVELDPAGVFALGDEEVEIRRPCNATVCNTGSLTQHMHPAIWLLLVYLPAGIGKNRRTDLSKFMRLASPAQITEGACNFILYWACEDCMVRSID